MVEVLMEKPCLKRILQTLAKTMLGALSLVQVSSFCGILLLWAILSGCGAQVRIQALVSLGELIPTLDKPCVMDILQTMARCASVDHSPPTLMCIVGVADVVQKEVRPWQVLLAQQCFIP